MSDVKRSVAVTDILGRTLDTIEVASCTVDHCVLHSYDPTIYSDEPELNLLFEGTLLVEVPDTLRDVRLVEGSLPAQFVHIEGVHAYNFIHSDIFPAEGRPYQVEILVDGSSRILYGRVVDAIVGRVIARRLTVEVVEGE